MKKSLLPTFLLIVFATCPLSAELVDQLDFSIAGQGVTHTTSGGFSQPSGTTGGLAPNDWTLTYGSVFSDTTLNEFITVGGVMRVQDWGGLGTITGSSWVASDDGILGISGNGLTIGTDVFNNVGVEGITWFYSINGGAQVSQFLDETELGGSAVGSGVDVGFDFTNISISAGDVVSYGFSVNVNGPDDGVEISSMTLDFTLSAIPEPTSIAMFGLAIVGLGFRRRKQAV